MNQHDRTVADVLEKVDAGARKAAWLILSETACLVAPPHARRMRAAVDDLVQECLFRAFERNATTLRRANPQTPLAAWAAETIKRISLESPPPRTAPIEAAVRLTPFSAAGSFEELEKHLYVLTPRQREVWHRVFELRETHAEAARRLGVVPSTLTGHVRAIVAKLRKAVEDKAGKATGGAKDRRWAVPLIRRVKSAYARQVLDLYIAGATYRIIGAVVGRSPGAVKKVVSRKRKRPPLPWISHYRQTKRPSERMSRLDTMSMFGSVGMGGRRERCVAR